MHARASRDNPGIVAPIPSLMDKQAMYCSVHHNTMRCQARPFCQIPFWGLRPSGRGRCLVECHDQRIEIPREEVHTAPTFHMPKQPSIKQACGTVGTPLGLKRHVALPLQATQVPRGQLFRCHEGRAEMRQQRVSHYLPSKPLGAKERHPFWTVGVPKPLSYRPHARAACSSSRLGFLLGYLLDRGWEE